MKPFADFLVACASLVEGSGLDESADLAGLPLACLGVGKAAATLGLMEALAELQPRGVLLFGVAGAYPARHRDEDPPVQPGDVCLVESEVFGDEGVELASGFRDLEALGLGEVGPFGADVRLTDLAAEWLGVPRVRSVTVSTCSGTEAASCRMADRSGADVETMEGAAVAYACRRLALPLVQLRGISNWTGGREQGEWDLHGAIHEVQAALRRLLAPRG